MYNISLDLNLPTTASEVPRHEVTTAANCASDDNSDFDDGGDNTNNNTNNDKRDGDGLEGGKGEGKGEGGRGCRVKGRRGRGIHTSIMHYIRNNACLVENIEH